MRFFTPSAYLLTLIFFGSTANSQEFKSLQDALTLHASFDDSLNADFSRGANECLVQQGANTVPAAPNDDVKISPTAGKYGYALHFTRKSKYWPQYLGNKVLNYNAENWSATVSVWLRLTPDEDLEPGYCDPIQIVGDDVNKGFIFMEWSKDHQPRHFRYAIRPLAKIWNPDNVGWEDIPDNKRPMVLVTKPIFSRDRWTHLVFTLENVNSKSAKPVGKLYVDGELQGAIENWDLTFGWDASKVRLVIGAAYVGFMDDLSVFNKALTAEEVRLLHELPTGAHALYQKQ